MLIVGLTGNIASGKTTSANFFRKLGAHVIESDEVARQFLKKDTHEYSEILKYFGTQIISADSSINRSKLAEVVFSNKEKLKVLNKILHPPTIEAIKQEIAKQDDKAIIIIESALILETNLKNLIQKLIVIKAPRRLQLQRLKNKQLSETDGKKRLSAQLVISQKLKKADFVINNSRDLKYLSSQIEKIWKELKNE